MLQEEMNCSQGTDGETPNHEGEEVHSAMKAPQVEDSLLHHLSFNKFILNYKFCLYSQWQFHCCTLLQTYLEYFSVFCFLCKF